MNGKLDNIDNYELLYKITETSLTAITVSDLSKFRYILLCTLGTKDYGTAGIYDSVIIPYNYLKNSTSGHVASSYYNSNSRYSYMQYVSDTSLRVYTNTIGLIYGIK